jgi:hypothetical protein
VCQGPDLRLSGPGDRGSPGPSTAFLAADHQPTGAEETSTGAVWHIPEDPILSAMLFML